MASIEKDNKNQERLDVVHDNYTKGIEIHQCSLGSCGECSIWEYSGHPNYFGLYDHFIGNVNCIHTLLFSLDQPLDEQLRQVRFWLSFLKTRIAPVEPLGDKGKSKKPAKVLLVASHADLVVCTKNVAGENQSKDANSVLKAALDEFGDTFDLHPRVFVMDTNSSNSYDMKALKQAIGDLKTDIIEVSVT